jgi:hypothetical protein
VAETALDGIYVIRTSLETNRLGNPLEPSAAVVVLDGVRVLGVIESGGRPLSYSSIVDVWDVSPRKW